MVVIRAFLCICVDVVLWLQLRQQRLTRAPAAPCACSRVNTASCMTTRDATRASALQVRRWYRVVSLTCVFCERIKAVCLYTSTTKIQIARCHEQEVHEVIASHRFLLIDHLMLLRDTFRKTLMFTALWRHASCLQNTYARYPSVTWSLATTALPKTNMAARSVNVQVLVTSSQ